jgi:branched-subunit amino acid aminotransferase/4-amino-4-deoxychorismate lyase
MAFTQAEQIILAVIVGTLFGIVYSLRILVLMERRVARLDANIERLVKSVLREEIKIEKAEERIEKKLKKR